MLMIEIYSPSVDKSYDFQISEDTLTKDAIIDFASMIAKKNGSSRQGAREDSSLFDVRRKRELNKGLTLRENGITNGAKLILADY